VPPTLLPEDGNIFIFRNLVLFIIPDDGQIKKSSNPECFRVVYFHTMSQLQSSQLVCVCVCVYIYIYINRLSSLVSDIWAVTEGQSEGYCGILIYLCMNIEYIYIHGVGKS
jgi:hypothetical protein